MDLVQLRYFAEVATLKSISKAAEKVKIAQPALTRQIKLLEEELGVQLLVRHSKGAQPTEAGILLAEATRSIFTLVEQVRQEVGVLASHPVGTLRLGFLPGFGPNLISRAVIHYRREFPNVELHLMEGYSDTLQAALLRDELDLVAMSEFETNRAFSVEPLYEEDLWLIAPPKARDAWGPPCTFEELVTKPLIQHNASNNLRQLLDNECKKRNLKLNVVVEAQGWGLVKELVQSGIGYTVCPYSIGKSEIQAKKLGGRPVKNATLLRVLLRRVDRPLTRAVSAMIGMIKAEVETLASKSANSMRVR